MTGTSPGSSAWPSILVASVLLAGLSPAPCSAQAPSGGTPGATAPSPALPSPTTPPAGGMTEASAGLPPPILRREVLDQPAGLMPSPEPSVAGLPALSHDHFGDGSGT